ERAGASVWRTAFFNMCVLGGVSAIFLVFAPQLVSGFTSDPAVAPYAIRCLRIVSSGFVFYAYGIVLTQAFNGAGDTLTPTLLNLLCFWLFEIPFAYLLARVLNVGPQGAFWAIALAFCLLAALTALLFRRGRWKLKRVYSAERGLHDTYPDRLLCLRGRLDDARRGIGSGSREVRHRGFRERDCVPHRR